MVQLRLTTTMLSTLAKAISMYRHVPFQVVEKARTSASDNEALEGLHNRIVRTRDTALQNFAESSIFVLTREEFLLMEDLLNQVLVEGESSPGDLKLHVAPIDEVREVRRAVFG